MADKLRGYGESISRQRECHSKLFGEIRRLADGTFECKGKNMLLRLHWFLISTSIYFTIYSLRFMVPRITFFFSENLPPKPDPTGGWNAHLLRMHSGSLRAKTPNGIVISSTGGMTCTKCRHSYIR